MPLEDPFEATTAQEGSLSLFEANLRFPEVPESIVEEYFGVFVPHKARVYSR